MTEQLHQSEIPKPIPIERGIEIALGKLDDGMRDLARECEILSERIEDFEELLEGAEKEDNKVLQKLMEGKIAELATILQQGHDAYDRLEKKAEALQDKAIRFNERRVV